jgi:hypothetical protein
MHGREIGKLVTPRRGFFRCPQGRLRGVNSDLSQRQNRFIKPRGGHVGYGTKRTCSRSIRLSAIRG